MKYHLNTLEKLIILTYIIFLILFFINYWTVIIAFWFLPSITSIGSALYGAIKRKGFLHSTLVNFLCLLMVALLTFRFLSSMQFDLVLDSFLMILIKPVIAGIIVYVTSFLIVEYCLLKKDTSVLQNKKKKKLYGSLLILVGLIYASVLALIATYGVTLYNSYSFVGKEWNTTSNDYVLEKEDMRFSVPRPIYYNIKEYHLKPGNLPIQIETNYSSKNNYVMTIDSQKDTIELYMSLAGPVQYGPYLSYDNKNNINDYSIQNRSNIYIYLTENMEFLEIKDKVNFSNSIEEANLPKNKKRIVEALNTDHEELLTLYQAGLKQLDNIN